MTHHNHENQKWHPAEELNGRLAMIGIVAAMNDPRYDRDPAYRQDIIEKLDRSDLEF